MLPVQYTLHGPRTISFISPPACLYVLVTMGQFHQLSWEHFFFWIFSSHITITHTPSIMLTSSHQNWFKWILLQKDSFCNQLVLVLVLTLWIRKLSKLSRRMSGVEWQENCRDSPISLALEKKIFFYRLPW